MKTNNTKNPTSTPKVTRSVAIDKAVAEAAQRQARREDRSFSNYVETLIAAEMKASEPNARQEVES